MDNALRVPRSSRSITGEGVAVGTNSAVQTPISSPGTASATAGSSGRLASRPGAVMPSAARRPSRTWGSAEGKVSNIRSTCPATSAAAAGAVLRNGTCSRSTPCERLEQLACQVAGRAVAAGSVGEPARSCPGLRQKRCHVGEAGAGVRDQQVRAGRHARDGREVHDGVVGQRSVKAHVHRLRADRAHVQRVAVGGAARGCLGADDTTRAGTVVHRDGLAEVGGQALGQDAPADVSEAARCEGDDHPDRARGPALRRCRQGPGSKPGSSCGQQCTAFALHNDYTLSALSLALAQDTVTVPAYWDAAPWPRKGRWCCWCAGFDAENCLT